MQDAHARMGDLQAGLAEFVRFLIHEGVPMRICAP
jgi:hypothetical protein